MTEESLPALLAEIARADLAALRALWRTYLSDAPPDLKTREVVRRLLAWQLQARLLGDIDQKTRRRIARFAVNLREDPKRALAAQPRSKPGTVLVRAFKGRQYRVVVKARGYELEGKLYGSLSDVAYAITGTRWSGPRFFGLTRKHESKKR